MLIILRKIIDIVLFKNCSCGLKVLIDVFLKLYDNEDIHDRLVMGWLVSPLVEDAELRERLWTESERLVGLAAF
jgi:hypothetical protein